MGHVDVLQQLVDPTEGCKREKRQDNMGLQPIPNYIGGRPNEVNTTSIMNDAWKDWPLGCDDEDEEDWWTSKGFQDGADVGKGIGELCRKTMFNGRSRPLVLSDATWRRTPTSHIFLQ